MSEVNVNTVAEKEQKVVVSPEDCTAALDFWKHFQIPVPAALQAAVDEFTANQNFENQQKVKLEVCRAISTTQHEAFQDEMFKKIVEECEGVTFEMQFDRDVTETLTVKE